MRVPGAPPYAPAVRRLAAAIPALLGSLAIAAPAGAVPGFSYVQTISDTTVAATHPAVATDARGDAIAAWPVISDAGDRVQWAYKPAGGTFGPPQNVFGALPHGQALYARYPAIAMDDAGDAIVTWSHGEAGTDPSGGTIQAAFRPAGAGTSFGAPATLSAPGAGMEPEVAMGPHGQAVVSWNGAHPVSVDGGGVVADGELAAYSSGGGTFGPAERLSDPAAPFSANSTTTPALGADGAAYVSWSGPRNSPGNHTGVFLAARPAGAAAFAPADVIDDEGLDYPGPTHLAVDGSGGVVATWSRQTSGTTSTRVRWAYRPAGGGFGVPADLTSGSLGIGGDVAVGPGGGAVAAVATAGAVVGEDTPFAIGASFRPSGGTFGPLGGLAPEAHSSIPSVGAGSDSFAVMWSQTDSIRFALAPVATGAFAAARDVAGTEPQAYWPTVVLDGSGSGVGVFQVTDASTGEIQAVFDAPRDTVAPRLATTPAPVRLAGRAIPFKVACDEACRLVVTGTVSVPGGAAAAFRLGRATRSLKPGVHAKLTLLLPRAAAATVKRALARHKHVAARLTVSARDHRGNKRTSRVTLRLKR
ncbi:MAG: hypothetical protein QOF37_2371 [Thermoleophilaceae bacterium]|nr:hypothetical protein [Thermoleophilaceae bacterium]